MNDFLIACPACGEIALQESPPLERCPKCSREYGTVPEVPGLELPEVPGLELPEVPGLELPEVPVAHRRPYSGIDVDELPVDMDPEDFEGHVQVDGKYYKVANVDVTIHESHVCIMIHSGSDPENWVQIVLSEEVIMDWHRTQVLTAAKFDDEQDAAE